MLPQPSFTALAGLQPPVFKVFKVIAYCYYCCYCSCPSTGRIFSYPNTITHIITLIIKKHKLWLIMVFFGLDELKTTAPTEKAPSYNTTPFFLPRPHTAPEVRFALGTQNQGECPPPLLPGATRSLGSGGY